MKKFILPLLMLIFTIALPNVSDASYIIHLKNGRRLITSYYWKEKNEIKICIIGGVIGIDENYVKKIEESDVVSSDDSFRNDSYPKTAEKSSSPLQTTSEISETKEKVLEKVDLKAYKSKKDEMMVELDELLEKQRKATSIGNNDAKEKLNKEIRKISDKIYKLSDEVTEKNKGKLPEGWWQK